MQYLNRRRSILPVLARPSASGTDSMMQLRSLRPETPRLAHQWCTFKSYLPCACKLLAGPCPAVTPSSPVSPSCTVFLLHIHSSTLSPFGACHCIPALALLRISKWIYLYVLIPNTPWHSLHSFLASLVPADFIRRRAKRSIWFTTNANTTKTLQAIMLQPTVSPTLKLMRSFRRATCQFSL